MPDPPAVPLLRWDEAPALGADVAVTTRHGGGSAAPYDTLNLGLHVGDDPATVVDNRARAAAAFGVALDDLVFARQVHGATAALVGPEDRGRGTRSEDDAVPDTDILVTTSRRGHAGHPGGRLRPAGAGRSRGRRPGRRPRRLARHRGRGRRPRPPRHAGLRRRRRAGARLPRAGRAARPLPGLRRGAPGLVRGGRARAPSTPPWRGPTAPATGSSTWSRPTASSWWPAGSESDHIVDSGATTADDGLLQRPRAAACGRFALLARLAG